MTTEAAPESNPLPTPAGLAGPGADLWIEVTAAWVFRPDELALLRQICETVSLLARMEKEINSADFKYLVRGSAGQNVAHPLLGELRAHRSTLTGMFRALSLPDLDDDEAVPVRSARSIRAQKAALARWGNR